MLTHVQHRTGQAQLETLEYSAEYPLFSSCILSGFFWGVSSYIDIITAYRIYRNSIPGMIPGEFPRKNTIPVPGEYSNCHPGSRGVYQLPSQFQGEFTNCLPGSRGTQGNPGD